MKKQLLLLVLFMGLFASSYAQDKKMFAGVNLGFSSVKDVSSDFNIDPSFGYWLKDNMALVGGIIFNSHTDKHAAPATDLVTTKFGIGAELRYGWHMGDHTFFYLAPGINFLSTSTDATGSKSDSDINIFLTPGVSYMLGDSWSINAEIGLLNFNSHKNGLADTSDSHFTVNTTMTPNSTNNGRGLTFGLWYHF